MFNMPRLVSGAHELYLLKAQEKDLWLINRPTSGRSEDGTGLGTSGPDSEPAADPSRNVVSPVIQHDPEDIGACFL